MKIRVGFEMIYECPQPTPMIFNLNVHFTRVSDLVGRDDLVFDPPVPMAAYRDSFGNWCTRIVAPKGRTRVSADAIVNDTGAPDVDRSRGATASCAGAPRGDAAFPARESVLRDRSPVRHGVESLRQAPTGWGRVQAICDYVHRHIVFGYEHARMTRTALEAYHDKTGVCRDYTHLAVAFCRCMNIPARYCTGYLGDIGVPPPHGTMDFAAWFEAFLDGRWYDVRRAQQYAAHRQSADRARSRRFRRRDQQHASAPTRWRASGVWTDEVRAG